MQNFQHRHTKKTYSSLLITYSHNLIKLTTRKKNDDKGEIQWHKKEHNNEIVVVIVKLWRAKIFKIFSLIIVKREQKITRRPTNRSHERPLSSHDLAQKQRFDFTQQRWFMFTWNFFTTFNAILKDEKEASGSKFTAFSIYHNCPFHK